MEKEMRIVRTDISKREDVVRLVDTFYEKVKTDSLLGPVFSHLNWEHHLPIMYSFWSSMLLGEQSYRGNPLQRHLTLPIEREHFSRWLELFEETVDNHFEGEMATEAKMRAHAIAGVFQYRLGLLSRAKV